MIEGARTLGDLLDKASERWPDREAIVFKGERLSYREYRKRVDQLAKALIRMGVQKGDKVSILFSNRPEWSISEYAVDKIGAIVVPINTRYKTHELGYILHHSDSTTLITMDRFLGIDYMDMLKEICSELPKCEPGKLQSEKLPFLKNVICLSDQRHPGTFDFVEFLKMGEEFKDDEALNELQKQVDEEDVAHIPYTSGTTGFPKGVMTTHYQYLWFNSSFAKNIGLKEGDRLCVPPPFCHNFGNSQGIHTPTLCGSCSIIVEYFDPLICLETIERERCTFFAGTPTMYIKMLQHPDFDKFNLTSLKLGLIAAAPAPVKLIHDITGGMGIKILIHGYGMTENSVGTSMTRPGDPPEIISTTVGKPFPGAQVKVIDPNTGKDLPPGKEGELCTKGRLIMKGYYKMTDESAKLIDENGWFHTGDLAVIDEMGYIKITGRLKDVFMPGGLNVSPEEVENILYAHSKIKQVTVVGVPDPVMGEVGMAFVELKEGEKETEEGIIQFCKGKIANFKIPKYVRFISEFPMTSTGKVQRFKLRERAICEMGLKGF
jgi:fatty-acyl-CoA synthase